MVDASYNNGLNKCHDKTAAGEIQSLIKSR